MPHPAEIVAGGALLLDFDGTLIAIAARPDAVEVPAAVKAALPAVQQRLAGALAIISGRSVEVLDQLLHPLLLPAAGQHGIQLRPSPPAPPSFTDVPQPPPDWLARAEALVARHPGTLLEPKFAGFVVHYRQNAAAAASVWQAMHEIIGADRRFELSPARMAVELRPRGIDKGTAVRALMQLPPFAGRRPIAIGDDVTDEDAFVAARTLGGIGLHMEQTFRTPDRLLRWLTAIAEEKNASAA